MTNLEQQFSENLMITQPSKSVRDPIPDNLFIDILSRVPAKSIARFRCVSKFWESILGCPYFTELFLTKSVARPRLFFTFRKKIFTLEDKDNHKELFVFSSPQPQNPDENSSLVATPYKAFPKRYTTEICSTSLYGMVCVSNRGDKLNVICNPITGESITLPKVKTKCTAQAHLFGFDPIKKQFKVLCVIESGYRTPNAYYVLTLETRERLWRQIHPLLPNHYLASDEIYINGVVYFKTLVATSWKILCFDFRSEKFDVINMDNNMSQNRGFTLLNYQGQLGAYQRLALFNYQGQRRDKSVLWVLEDAGKHKWSKRTLELSPSVDKIFDQNRFVGMTGTGELVFSSHYLSNLFNIFYYSIERNILTRFKIQGFEEFRHRNHVKVNTILDYVENLKMYGNVLNDLQL